MATRAVLSAFERFQAERMAFVSSVADMSKQSQNVEVLQQAGAMQLLRPLLLDNVPSIQQAAVLALGRLANHSSELAEAVVSNDILPQLVQSINSQSRYCKKSAAFCFKAVARHSASLAQSVVACGALEAFVSCLEDFDACVKESAAWALGYVASHNAELAQQVVGVGAIPLLVVCVQEPEIALKRAAASALSDVAKHGPEQARTVIDAGAVACLAPLVLNQDPKLKRQICIALSQVAKHNLDLAEAITEASVFPQALTCLLHPDAAVCAAAAGLVRDVVKHSAELAQLIVAAGGVSTMAQCMKETGGAASLPCIMGLGYIAAFGESLAMAVIAEHAIAPLVRVVHEDSHEHMMAAAAWTLGQIGKHTSDHAMNVAETGCLQNLADIESGALGEDLRAKARRSLKSIVSKLMHLPALDALIQRPMSDGVTKAVLEQLGKVLAVDSAGRAAFVQSGGLAKIQEIAEQPGSRHKELAAVLNSQYPEEVVRYYSPAYSQQLLQKLTTGA